ncbi:hypothetical protein [Nocardiopsis valliformis]|uniref:hypothetical protein n=1 Tax=Nocardiopsis valliformis TaxID=239974 RepID=UPI0012683DE3|nr:hypothetical protein [Nocardiopsis valliformis]
MAVFDDGVTGRISATFVYAGIDVEAKGLPATEQLCARLSPLGFGHINFLGSYTFPTDPKVEVTRTGDLPGQQDGTKAR